VTQRLPGDRDAHSSATKLICFVDPAVTTWRRSGSAGMRRELTHRQGRNVPGSGVGKRLNPDLVSKKAEISQL
jgi:hypothetical protein